MSKIADHLILGAGWAGLAMADALRAEWPTSRIHMLEGARPGSEASAVPQAMLHPVPGLSLSPNPDYLQAFSWMRSWLESRARTWTQQNLGSPTPTWLWKTSLLRPLFLQEAASQRLLRSFQQSRDAYEPHVSATAWTAEDVARQYPALCQSQGGIVFEPAYALDMPVFLQNLSQDLQGRGVQIFPQTPALHIHRVGEAWCVETASDTWLTEHLILTVGSALRDWFPHLPIVLTGGTLAAVQPSEMKPEDPSVGALGLPGLVSYRGHIVPWPGRDWMLGATYHNDLTKTGESWFSWSKQSSPHTNPSEDATHLQQQLGQLCPCVQHAPVQRIWQQCRTVFHPDREPVVGNIPPWPNLHVLGGLASKGLLLGGWLAHRWVQWLRGGVPIPAWANTKRYPTTQWTRQTPGEHIDRFQYSTHLD